ncbi:MAG: outer membrane beta-barrel protein [Flavipsychrobacter sp.]
MKKLTFILTVLSALSLKAEAKKFYIRAGIGYAAPTAGQTRDVDGYPLNGTVFYNSRTSPESTIMHVHKASYGSGVKTNLAVGYFINDHIGVELNGIFGVASTKYVATAHYIAPNSPEIIVQYTQYAKLPIFLVPSLTLQTGDKIRLYMRAGIVLPVKSDMISEADNLTMGNYYPAGTQMSIKATVRTRFNLGLSASAGVNFKISKHVRFFTEANLTSLSLYLKDVSYGSTKLNYTKQANSAASEDGTYSYPFSTIGGSLGLEFNL